MYQFFTSNLALCFNCSCLIGLTIENILVQGNKTCMWLIFFKSNQRKSISETSAMSYEQGQSENQTNININIPIFDN